MSQLWRELALCDWPQEPEQLSLRREEVTGSATARTSMDFATRLYRTEQLQVGEDGAPDSEKTTSGSQGRDSC